MRNLSIEFIAFYVILMRSNFLSFNLPFEIIIVEKTEWIVYFMYIFAKRISIESQAKENRIEQNKIYKIVLNLFECSSIFVSSKTDGFLVMKMPHFFVIAFDHYNSLI